MDCSTPGFPVLHYLPEFAQTHVHRVGDAIQPSHPLSSPSLLPSVFPSIRVISNESALPIRWLKLSHYLLSKTTSATAHRPRSSILCLVRTAPLEQLPAWGMLAYVHAACLLRCVCASVTPGPGDACSGAEQVSR